MLAAFRGKTREVNARLLRLAFERLPSLVLDCAACADPMALPFASQEELEAVFVVEIDLLYSLRDALLQADALASALDARVVIVTTFHHLFHYQDEAENAAVVGHIWELFSALGERRDVLVGVKEGHPWGTSCPASALLSTC
ncbi:hypothetical protein J4439_00250 [Candidatus Woesearchaeota archaeon]|nr:hypothetical protein [Candidatus Woesearchaeota archaeon]